MCQRNNVLMGKIESFASDDIIQAKFEFGDPSGEPSQSEDESIHSGSLKGRQNNFTLVELHLKKNMKFAQIFNEAHGAKGIKHKAGSRNSRDLNVSNISRID